jgi:S-adenosylmethionine synthetase
MKLVVFANNDSLVGDRPVEYVERKGLGHPDSICDSVMEAAAEALRREYLDRCGQILHHNLDKALLVAGQSEPKFRGGSVINPMRIIAGDRATSLFGDIRIPVDEIVSATVRRWIGEHLRFVDPEHHVVVQSEIKPGSAELAAIFAEREPVANDTSATVGFAPLTETENLVLSVERLINSPAFKQKFPMAGEDVKVMAVRHDKTLHLTIAIAMVDRFIESESAYFDHREAIRCEIREFATQRLRRIEQVMVDLNSLDKRSRGLDGMYLTVTGTSAESGDGGEVGRGNAVNGLISLNRPSGAEAAAGKNTLCHVGNIYSHLCFKLADEIVEKIGPVREACVWLCSQIGRPVANPLSASVQLALDGGISTGDVEQEVNAIVRHALHGTFDGARNVSSSV